MKKACRAILFAGLMAVLIMTLNHLTLNRSSEGCIQLHDFYGLEENRADLLCIGSSHVYYGINTCLLFEDYGIASYLLASPGQPVWISYYLLEEALKTQEPEMVLYDTGTLFQKEDDFGAYSWETLISMKPSLTKWNALKAVNRYGEVLDMAAAFFSFPYYHSRFLSLGEQDYRNLELVRYHGYKPDFGVISESELSKWENRKKPDSEKELPLAERSGEYLLKMIQLCEENEIPLVFVNSPFANQSLEKRETANYVASLAAEHGIPMLEGNDYVEEMQIDFATDLLDASHLNYYGSVKYTQYLAEWLQESAALPDRRGDIRYWAWEEAGEQFWHLELKGRMLSQIETRDAYLDAIEEHACLDAAVCWEPDGEVSVYESGECIFQGTAEQDYERYLELDGMNLVIRCLDGKLQVWADDKQYLFAEDGLNVLVYGKAAQRMIDGAGFDGQDRKGRLEQ